MCKELNVTAEPTFFYSAEKMWVKKEFKSAKELLLVILAAESRFKDNGDEETEVVLGFKTPSMKEPRGLMYITSTARSGVVDEGYNPHALTAAKFEESNPTTYYELVPWYKALLPSEKGVLVEWKDGIEVGFGLIKDSWMDDEKLKVTVGAVNRLVDPSHIKLVLLEDKRLGQNHI